MRPDNFMVLDITDDDVLAKPEALFSVQSDRQVVAVLMRVSDRQRVNTCRQVRLCKTDAPVVAVQEVVLKVEDHGATRVELVALNQALATVGVLALLRALDESPYQHKHGEVRDQVDHAVKACNVALESTFGQYKTLRIVPFPNCPLHEPSMLTLVAAGISCAPAIP